MKRRELVKAGWAADEDSSLNDRKHILDVWRLQIYSP